MIRPVFLALALALLPLSAMAAEETAPRSADHTTVLHLTEQAQRRVARDELRAVLRVEAADADAAHLQQEINQRMAAAVTRAKAVPGVTVETSGYSIYEERAQNKPPQWHGSASLVLTTKEAPPLLALVGELQQNGLAMSSLAYQLTPEAARAVEDQLTATAIQRLRERAERVARGLGLAVRRIRDLRLGNAAGTPPLPRPFLSAGMAAAAATPVAEPGEATVSVSVEAEVLLGPKR
jgi:predicted secreted protein